MSETNDTPEAAESPVSEPRGEEAASVEQGEISKDARRWAMFCHLAGLAWLLWWIAPLIGGVVGALIMWQMKKDEYAFVDEQGKEALNFQISMLIYVVIAGLLCFVCIGMVLLPIVMVVDIVFSLIASVKACRGEAYRYPLTIRFVK